MRPSDERSFFDILNIMVETGTLISLPPPQNKETITEEVGDLAKAGITNLEWIRYRLTGEFPERITPMLEVRRKSQIEGHNQWKWVNELGKNSKRELSDSELDTLKALTLAVLDKIYTHSDDTLGYPDLKTDTDHLRVLYLIGLPLYIAGLKDRRFVENLGFVIDRAKNKLRPIAINRESESRIKAAAIENLCFLKYLNPEGSRESIDDLFEECIEAKDTETLRVLLQSGIVVGNETMRFIYLNWRNIVSMVPKTERSSLFIPILDGLCSFTITQQPEGYERIGGTSFLISQFGKEIRKDPFFKDDQYLKHFQNATNAYTSALAGNTNEIQTWNPSHHITQTILETLTQLYIPVGATSIEPLPELLPFLQKLYYNKVVLFSTKSSVPHWLHEWFIDIARYAKLSMRDITQRSSG